MHSNSSRYADAQTHVPKPLCICVCGCVLKMASMAPSPSHQHVHAFIRSFFVFRLPPILCSLPGVVRFFCCLPLSFPNRVALACCHPFRPSSYQFPSPFTPKHAFRGATRACVYVCTSFSLGSCMSLSTWHSTQSFALVVGHEEAQPTLVRGKKKKKSRENVLQKRGKRPHRCVCSWCGTLTGTNTGTPAHRHRSATSVLHAPPQGG